MTREELEMAQAEMRERMQQRSQQTSATAAQEELRMPLKNKERVVGSLVRKMNFQQEATASALHKLAAATEALLARAPADENGIIISPSDKCCLDIRVSEAQLQRAISVASMLIFALEEKGFTVTAGCRVSLKSESDRPTSVRILDQDVAFYIEEDLHVRERRERQWSTHPELIYEPSGKLMLRVSSYVDKRTPCRQKWADGKTQSLEGLMPSCIEGLIKNAERMAALAAERQAWEMERKEREEQRRRAQEEAARIREAERLYALANPDDPAVLKKKIADLEKQNEALRRERESESIRHSYEKESSFWAGRNRRW